MSRSVCPVLTFNILSLVVYLRVSLSQKQQQNRGWCNFCMADHVRFSRHDRSDRMTPFIVNSQLLGWCYDSQLSVSPHMLCLFILVRHTHTHTNLNYMKTFNAFRSPRIATKFITTDPRVWQDVCRHLNCETHVCERFLFDFYHKSAITDPFE